MGVELLTERHAGQIAGVLGCWDRMLVFGTLPKICFAGGMTSFLYERKIRIFDYPKFAEPFRNRIRENAEKMAAEAGIEIEFIRKRNFRKEDRVKEIGHPEDGPDHRVHWHYEFVFPAEHFNAIDEAWEHGAC